MTKATRPTELFFSRLREAMVFLLNNAHEEETHRVDWQAMIDALDEGRVTIAEPADGYA